MHDVGWVAIFGTLGMLLAVVVVVPKLMLRYLANPSAVPATEMVAKTTFQVHYMPCCCAT